MKFAFSLVAFLLLLGTIAFGQDANSANSGSIAKPASVPAGETSITGCLSGHHDEYRLTEKDGTVHLLLSAQKNGLRSHVGNIVELAGHADNNRDASSSSDEGTAHGQRFFQVNEIISDSGKCK